MIKLFHPTEGTLRRIVDEPLLVPDRTRDHVRSCPRCSVRLLSSAAAAEAIRRLLPTGPEPVLDSRSAWAAVQRRRRTAGPAPRPTLRERLPRWLTNPGRPTAAVAVIAALAVATGTGTAVAGVHWTQIFSPAAVAPVPVTRAELLALPHISEFGQLTRSEGLKLTPEPTLAAAVAASGVTLALPGSLPQGVTGSPSYFLVPRWSATFTFSSARAQAAGLAAGVVLPPLPAGFDGTQLRESVGPGVLAVYGTGSGAQLLANLPTLALMAVQPPILDSTGATVAQLENYLLSLPFLPPSLAAAIHQLGNPITTLPIPVLPGLGQPQATTVHREKAVLFGAGSQLLAAVVWEQQGTVRAVGGLLDPATVLALARG
ncbi:MAG TPA: hypothetical protein VNF24_06520 [Candidatus Acidoferrales bacterium]|nr:hypothetical protein [Candidatus Acidoferrales bacterium]